MRNLDPTKAYRLFYPAVPALFAASSRGAIAAMPVVSCMAVSNAPARVAVAVSPLHRTYRIVLAAQAFSLSWLDRKFAKAVESLGTRSAATFRDKLAAGGLTHKWGVILRVPVVVEASAVLECSLAEIHKLGDHDLLVGDIRNAYASSDFSEYWKFKQYHPMLYVGSERGFQVRSMEAKATREASSPR